MLAMSCTSKEVCKEKYLTMGYEQESQWQESTRPKVAPRILISTVMRVNSTKSGKDQRIISAASKVNSVDMYFIQKLMYVNSYENKLRQNRIY